MAYFFASKETNLLFDPHKMEVFLLKFDFLVLFLCVKGAEDGDDDDDDDDGAYADVCLKWMMMWKKKKKMMMMKKKKKGRMKRKRMMMKCLLRKNVDVCVCDASFWKTSFFLETTI